MQTSSTYQKIDSVFVLTSEHTKLRFGYDIPKAIKQSSINSLSRFGSISKITILGAGYKGATSEEKELEKSQAAFYDTLKSAYTEQFGKQSALFSAIQSVYQPIFEAGPGQFGLSHDEETALRTQASEGTAANYMSASRSVAERLASAGGGNSFLPSGAAESIKANVAAQAAGQESSQQLDITKAGYEIGRQNFLNASNTLMGVAAGYNPLGYAGAAENAGKSAFDMASEIQKADAAASPWGTIGGLIGGVAGSFLGPIGSQAGSKVGGWLGNAGSTNSWGASAADVGKAGS